MTTTLITGANRGIGLALVRLLAARLQGTTLDWLLANAGILRDDSLRKLDFDPIREQLEVNALGPLRTPWRSCTRVTYVPT